MTRASPQALEAHRQLLGYLRNNQHRMDYPTDISRGWQIGSGMVEAAWKTVVCQRLKESGMRWREHGTTALSQLRALDKSEPKLWKNYGSTTNYVRTQLTIITMTSEMVADEPRSSRRRLGLSPTNEG